MTGAGPSLLQAAPRSDGRTGAHCSAARVRTQYHESLQNVSSVMRSGAKLIHKSSNSSGTLPRIENYVGLRIESIGDIEITDPKDGSVVEAVDIKHGRSITADTVRKAYGRFKAEPVKRYYLLTTAGIGNAEEVAQEVDRIQEEHGCQVIVGDVSDILKRHLQMLKSPDDFIASYVELVEDDISIKYAHKMSWNNVVSTMR